MAFSSFYHGYYGIRGAFLRLDSALKKRRPRTKPEDRMVARISKQTYPFIRAYAMKHELNIEEAVDELVRISLQNIYFLDGVTRRENILSRGLNILRGQFRSKVTELPISKQKIKIGDARNRVLNKKPKFKNPT